MPLYVPDAPAPALRSVLAALCSPTAVRAARTPSLRDARGPLVPDHPLPLHLLDPVSSRAGGIPRARLTGWRFLIRGAEEGVVAAAETMITPDGWAFSYFCEGPYLASTERALRQAEALPAPYQPRLLSIPGLYMLCLWLHGDVTDGDDAQPAPADVLIPLAPAPPGIAAHRPHRAADLLPVLTHRLTPAPLLRTVV
ncbi:MULTISPECIES: hypothetical protein [Streptomycetaceae]|uniref:Secreted protein n=1 Tax=Streptantibioticus cattleyicolor (strain ATCC 35852 / DSM 46488 / JCM 4925 / NBRC 14057 / NRRL 8057) TaxID=1003195 RepID=F8JU67_STREN|nr:MULTISPECIES: hypothetical protein [Streptomycetaceae]AEW93082.1 secreted protein [Streptantibioticus cattleyicolor NRRL 8057 = DSM 46488]MYS57813.1 hypothetical protein [Streptomyces sp. SID5468]CCB73440.1 Secreted protein [Streptantibioticus cattleyicolor NRRL 8057 = DSM 46488]